MNASLSQQKDTLERMLGERMLRHADTILRQWIQELGEPAYFDQIEELNANYNSAFKYFLTGSNTDRDDVMLVLTHRYYLLTDELYAKLRLKRGEVPQMYGFGPDNRESCTNYFAANVLLTDEDLDWMRKTAEDNERQGLAICCVASLAANIRMGFNERAMFCLLDIAQNGTPAGEQALAQVILLLAHYDVRIDFFEDIQNQFLSIIENNPDNAFYTLGAMVKSIQPEDINEFDEEAIDQLPNELFDVLEADHENMAEKLSEEINKISPYMHDMAVVLPDTWVFSVICDTDEKREKLARLYANVGLRDTAFESILMSRLDLCGDDELKADMLLWEELADEALDLYLKLDESGHGTERIRFRIGWCALLVGELDIAEKYMVERLRGKHVTIDDYINYGHLCWLKGDRLTAYENYREARRMCKSIKQFKESFCPDRKVLSELGIPLDQIYLMEDQLIILND